MTNIITRYFETAKKAQSVVFELVHLHRMSPQIIEMFEDAEGVADKLTAKKVAPETAQAYQKKMASGGAVVMVRAGRRPLGAAKIARQGMDAMAPVDMGALTQEVVVKDSRPPTTSVMRDHPHMMTRTLTYKKKNFYMADWPIGLISRRKPFKETTIRRDARYGSWLIDNLLPGSVRFGRFPFGLLAPHDRRYGRFPFDHLVPHDKRYGRFPFGFLVPHEKRYGRFPFGFLVPHNRRYGRFPFGHLVPNHNRMAAWPFPLLINGKQGENALAPDNKRYGRFPFGLLVSHSRRYGRFPFGFLAPHNRRYGRFPFGLLVPGQKFMAKFPFAHIVPGHKHMAGFPFGHIVPGHKYMANFILPHTKSGNS